MNRSGMICFFFFNLRHICCYGAMVVNSFDDIGVKLKGRSSSDVLGLESMLKKWQ